MKILLILSLIPFYITGQPIEISSRVIRLSDNYSEKNPMIFIKNEDGSIWYEFSFFYNDSDGKWDYPNSNFKPLSFHPDYFNLVAKVVDKKNEKVEIVVNEKTQLTRFLDLDYRFELLSFEEYVLNCFAIRFDKVTNPVLDSANGNVKKIEFKENTRFIPKKIQGEWLLIEWSNTIYKPINGWIKWKVEKKLIIDLYCLS